MHFNRLHVAHLCYAASAQTAAYRLHRSLLLKNCESRIITGSRSISDEFLLQPATILQKASATTGVLRELLYKKLIGYNNRAYFSLNVGPELLQYIWLNEMSRINTQIIHLHWIGNGFLPLKRLRRFDQPLVWTMHDVWAFTGGCHVNGTCDKYKTKCGSCPLLQSTKSYDLSTKLFNEKMAIYRDVPINIVVPSSWMESRVKESALLSHARVCRIPNALDITVFKPLSKNFARHALDLDKDKKVIAYGGISPFSDPNKGFDLLVPAIKKAAVSLQNVVVVIFGAESASSLTFDIGCKVKVIGRLFDDVSLAMVYSAADVVVVPSRQESYSQVTAEAIACGTPVVAFRTTGLVDTIDHKLNGYLAEPYDANDLAHGIEWILGDTERRESLSRNARQKAINSFSYDVIATEHLRLYEEILHGYHQQ